MTDIGDRYEAHTRESDPPDGREPWRPVGFAPTSHDRDHAEAPPPLARRLHLGAVMAVVATLVSAAAICVLVVYLAGAVLTTQNFIGSLNAPAFLPEVRVESPTPS